MKAALFPLVLAFGLAGWGVPERSPGLPDEPTLCGRPVGKCEPYAEVCRFCTDCSKCGHCAGKGGLCSVCKDKPEKPSKAEMQQEH